MNHYAVLTGDIVKSLALSPDHLKNIRQTLDRSLQEFNAWKDKKIIEGTMDFYRGDGWQTLMSQPQFCLRLALFLRSSLRAYNTSDTRIAIGIGEITQIDKKNISQSIGEAFTLSGLALDKLKRRYRMTVAIASPKNNPELPMIFGLCDALAQKWSPRQAETIRWALLELRQTDIAEKMSITQPAATKALGDSGWFALEPVLEGLENNNIL